MATSRLFANMLNEGAVKAKPKQKKKKYSPWPQMQNKGMNNEKK